MSSQNEIELNYVKIDSENEIEFLTSNNYATEISLLFETFTRYEEYKIAKKISKDIEKNIQQDSELLKYNIDFAKKFIKIITSDKRKKLNASVKRILSIDFGNEFIFNYSNIFDVCSIVTLLFTECKKYKITSIDDLKNITKKINLQKYDFYRLYLDFNKNNKKRNTISNINKNSTSLFSKAQENNLNRDCKTLESNVKNNFVLNNDFNYLKEEESIKTITRNTFIYPEYNKIGNKGIDLNKTELPIELLMLLSKLKQVKCLIFQIQNIEKNYIELANFILSNIDWLFIKGIEQIKFDLCNDEIQQGLDKTYDKVTEELYSKNNINKNLFYYNGNYSARRINCWIPECDFFFDEKEKEIRNKECNYRNQFTDDSVFINEYTCNIYNIFGNLMNIKYIPKIDFSNFINFNSSGKLSDSRGLTPSVDSLNNHSTDLLNESDSIFDLEIDDFENIIKKSMLNENNIQILNNNEIPFPLVEISEKYNKYFKMVLIYSYYLSRSWRNIISLSLFFHNSFSYEININYKIELNSELTHFLIFLNKMEFLQEINISFNALDDKSFEYILGLLHKNTLLSKVRISFFTPDLNYYDNSLFNLCASKKIDLNQLFSDYFEKEKKVNKSNERKLLDEKLLNPFILNLCNLSNLLKLQLIKSIEELVFRFDIPLPLINYQKYKIVIIKFIMNILIMLTFQYNKTRTFKILAPNLEINGIKMPFIKTFFNEISLSDEENNKNGETKKSMENGDKKEGIQNNINKQFLPKNSSETAAIRKNSSEKNNNIDSNSDQFNYNNNLENLVIQLKICFLPEIFNFCKINNLAGLKYINLGNLDEISFKGFVDDYKLNYTKLQSLVTLKINLGFSVLFYDNLEKYIFDFININSKNLQEKLLLSNLIINNEDKMEKLIELVYLKANIEKLVIKINYENINLLSKLLTKFTIQYQNKCTKNIYSLMLALNHPKCKKINKKEIITNLCDFIIFSKYRTILCNEKS